MSFWRAVAAGLLALCFHSQAFAQAKVYYLTGNSLRRAAATGGNNETLATTPQGWPNSVAIDPFGGKVYWAGTTIGWANLDGTGAETRLEIAGANLFSVSLDLPRRKLYWANLTGNHIQRADLDTLANVETVYTSDVGLGHIAVDSVNQHVYFTNYGSSVYRVNFDGTGRTTVVSGRTSTCGIALDVEHGWLFVSDDGVGQVFRRNLDGSGNLSLFYNSNVDQLAVDPAGGNVYVSMWTGNSVWSVPEAGGSVETVVSGLPYRALGVGFLPALPTVTTGDATTIAGDGATLTGTVNANGLDATTGFEWGLTTAYGNSAAATPSSVSGNAETAISAALTGLIPATTYHYRAIATTPAGSGYGADRTFESARIAPSATTDPATDVTATGATLNASVNANNRYTVVTFRWGPTTAYGSFADVASFEGMELTAVSHTLTDLAPNTTYHFQVAATNDAGSTDGADQEFTTAAVLPTVTTLAVSGLSAGGVTLNGSVNAQNSETTAWFEYSTDPAFAVSSTVAASPSSFAGSTDTEISASLSFDACQTYYYRVVAQNSAGTTEGAPLSFSWQSEPTVSGVLVAPASRSADISATVYSDYASFTARLEYGTTTAYGSTLVNAALPGGSDQPVSFSVAELSPNTTYHFRIVVDDCWGSHPGDDQTFVTDGEAPQVVTLGADAVDASGATLHASVTPNNSSTAVTFEYGETATYGESVTAAESPMDGMAELAASAVLSGLEPNTTYHYRVVGVNAAGTQAGDDRTFTTSMLAPTAVTSAATDVSGTGATLHGSANGHNATTTVEFEYGLTTSYGSTVVAAESPVSSNDDAAVSAALAGLAPNTTYHYRLVATNGAGTSQGSDQTFTTSVVLPSVGTGVAEQVLGRSATLVVTANARNASTEVWFEYGVTTAYGTATNTVPVTGLEDTEVGIAIADLVPNTTYHFRAVARNEAGTVQGTDADFTTLVVAPLATTDGASAITATTATIFGIVNANNSDTNVTFEYGTTAAYGTAVSSEPSMVSGTEDTSVQVQLTDLEPNTTYHYRVVAMNDGGTVEGADQTFTTSMAVPTVATGTADGISASGATLHGTANARNAGTTVRFEYGLTGAYGSTATAAQSPLSGNQETAVSAALAALAPNTTYHYRLVATNGAGTVEGEDRTFTTSMVLPTVTTRVAEGVAPRSATLVATANARNASTEVTFEYGLTTAYGTRSAGVTVLGLDDTDVRIDVAELLPNATYHYRALAQSAAGSVQGADATFTTPGLAPVATTGNVSAVTLTSATLGGTVNANNAATSVFFEYGTTASYGTTVPATPASVSGTTDTSVSVNITDLAPNTTYHFRVFAENATGRTVGLDRSFATGSSAPTAVTLAADAIEARGATLHARVDPQNAATAISFEYGPTDSYGSTITASPSELSGIGERSVAAVLTLLVPNTTYHFRVVAESAVGTTRGEDLTFHTLALAPTVASNAPTAITATAAQLSGTVNGNNSATTIQFEYGTTTSYGSQQAASPASTSSATDVEVSLDLSALVPNTTYHYRLVATNAAGTTRSEDRSFATLAAAPTVATGTATNITASAADLAGTVNAHNSSTTVTFEYGPTTGYGSVASVQDSVEGTEEHAVQVHLTGLSPDTTYHFRIVATNQAGTTQGADQTFTTAQDTPLATTLDATEIGPFSATLRASVNPRGHATKVEFEYGTTEDYGTLIEAEAALTGDADVVVTWAIAELSANTSYHFRVVATSSAGTVRGQDQVFTTAVVAPPLAVTLPVTDVTATTATLHGTVNPQQAATTAIFEYGTTTSYGRTVAASPSSLQGTQAQAVSGQLAGLDPGTTYHYRLVATNAGGRAEGSDLTFTTAVDVTRCTIDGVPYDDGETNPANACQFCDPAQREEWSNRAAGAPCADDGLSCTTDACDGSGTCRHEVTTGCLVAGACVASGALQQDNTCQECRPTVARDRFSARAEETPCASDGVEMTSDVCVAGVCEHPSQSYSLDAEGCGCSAPGAGVGSGLWALLFAGTFLWRRRQR